MRRRFANERKRHIKLSDTLEGQSLFPKHKFHRKGRGDSGWDRSGDHDYGSKRKYILYIFWAIIGKWNWIETESGFSKTGFYQFTPVYTRQFLNLDVRGRTVMDHSFKWDSFFVPLTAGALREGWNRGDPSIVNLESGKRLKQVTKRTKINKTGLNRYLYRYQFITIIFGLMSAGKDRVTWLVSSSWLDNKVLGTRVQNTKRIPWVIKPTRLALELKVTI